MSEEGVVWELSMELSLYYAHMPYRSPRSCTLSISGKGLPLIEYYFGSEGFSSNHVMEPLKMCFIYLFKNTV